MGMTCYHDDMKQILLRAATLLPFTTLFALYVVAGLRAASGLYTAQSFAVWITDAPLYAVWVYAVACVAMGITVGGAVLEWYMRVTKPDDRDGWD